MTLSTHAVIGAAAAKLFGFNPIVAFCAAFLSHSLIDMIPHWDYQIKSLVKNIEEPMKTDIVIGKYFLFDVSKVIFDGALGILISLLVFPPYDVASLFVVALGVFGGILPDAFQFFYWKLRREPFATLQCFHIFMHSKKEIKQPLIGALGQFVVAWVVLVFTLSFL